MVDKKLAWTDAEKAAVLFQLIPHSIPWNTIALPEGRTLKAVQIMISKEKEKLKRAKEGLSEEGVEGGKGGASFDNASPAGKKRYASEALDEVAKPKTAKVAKVKKTAVEVEDDSVVQEENGLN